MRVLVLPRYTRAGASSRMRFYQYLPRLEASGLRFEVSPLFGDEYLACLQKDGHKSTLEALRGYIGRVGALLTATRFDLLWIEKDALPWLPAAIETRLYSSGVPYVLDYDDAVFHQYDLHRNTLVRRLLSSKHERVMRGAACVVAGNGYIGDHARRAGARLVEIIPTVVDMERYSISSPRVLPCSQPQTVVGWIGQRSTAYNLNILVDTAKRLNREGRTKFVAVGAGNGFDDSLFETLPWSEESEISHIANFDIGVMPLLDGPFERGKCGYKLIQYMACGKPVVASPVGVNCEIVEHGVNGYLAETDDEWEFALRSLTQDSDLRERMGSAGRSKVEAMYSLQATLPRLADILHAAVN